MLHVAIDKCVSCFEFETRRKIDLLLKPPMQQPISHGGGFQSSTWHIYLTTRAGGCLSGGAETETEQQESIQWLDLCPMNENDSTME